MSMLKRWRRWSRKRGFSHVSQTLEAAAVMSWFAVCVIGERYLADATHARRDAEVSAQQSSVHSAYNYCQGGDSGSVGSATTNTQISQNGTLSISNFMSLVTGLFFGAQPTFSLYSDPFQASGSSSQAAMKASAGGGAATFHAERSMACLERSKDSPASPPLSLKQYRLPIFIEDVMMYAPLGM